MALTIEFQKTTKSVPSRHAGGGGVMPGVVQGSNVLGDALDRGRQAYVQASGDAARRMKLTNDMLLENQTMEAMQALDDWNRKAMYGTPQDGSTSTLAMFDGEADETKRLAGVNGLAYSKGMMAGDASQVYEKSSKQMLEALLRGKSPEVQRVVRQRAHQMFSTTQTRLNEHAQSEQYKVTLENQNALIVGTAQRAASDATMTHKVAKERRDSVVSEAEAAYRRELEVEGIKEEWSEGKPEGADWYALQRRNGAVAEAEVEYDAAILANVNSYNMSLNSARATKRAQWMRLNGYTEEKLQADGEAQHRLDFELKSFDDAFAGKYIETLIDNGNYEFATTLLHDKNVSAGGLTYARSMGLVDSNTTAGLENKLATKVAQVKKANEEQTRAVAAFRGRCELTDEGGNWVVPTETVIEEAVKLEAAGRGDLAETLYKKVADRQTAMRGNRALNEKGLAPLSMAAVDEVLNALAYNSNAYVVAQLADGTKVVVTRQAAAQHLVENYKRDLTDEQKTKYLKKFASEPTEGYRYVKDALGDMSNVVGWRAKGDDEVYVVGAEEGIETWQYEQDGKLVADDDRIAGDIMYWTGETAFNPLTEDEAQYRDRLREAKWLNPENAKRLAALEQRDQNVQSGQWKTLTPKQWQALLVRCSDAVAAAIEAHPEWTETERRTNTQALVWYGLTGEIENNVFFGYQMEDLSTENMAARESVIDGLTGFFRETVSVMPELLRGVPLGQLSAKDAESESKKQDNVTK